MKLTKTLASFALGLSLMASAAGAEVAPGDVAFVDGYLVEASLTGAAGNAENGKKVFLNRKLGNCLACHANSDAADQPFHGEVGPSLDEVADRYSEAEIRAIVINAKQAISDDTIMPGFYSLELGVRVADKFAGKTILSAADVEDVVAYLLTLK